MPTVKIFDFALRDTPIGEAYHVGTMAGFFLNETTQQQWTKTRLKRKKPYEVWFFPFGVGHFDKVKMTVFESVIVVKVSFSKKFILYRFT